MTKSIILQEKEICPFCASNDIRHEQDTQANGVKVWVCWCGNCGAFGPTDLGWSGAIEKWNMRRPRAKLLLECKIVLKELEEITTDEFSRGADKALRDRLEQAITFAEGE